MRYILLTAILLLLVGCGTLPGKLEIVDAEYPESVSVSKDRQIDFTFTLKNTGEKDCIVQNIYSPDFWKIYEPGSSGNTNSEFDMVLSPGDVRVFSIPGYIWDADTIRDHMKRFAFTVNIVYSEDCPQAFLTHEGLIWFYK